MQNWKTKTPAFKAHDLLLLIFQYCNNPKINQSSELRFCQHFVILRHVKIGLGIRREWWWNTTNREDVKKDQRSEVKEEGLKFSRGPGRGNPSGGKLMRHRLKKHPLWKQFHLCN